MELLCFSFAQNIFLLLRVLPSGAWCSSQVWEMESKDVKDEEAIKEKLCEDLKNLVWIMKFEILSLTVVIIF